MPQILQNESAESETTGQQPSALVMNKHGLLPASTGSPELVSAYGEVLDRYLEAMSKGLDSALAAFETVRNNRELSGLGKNTRLIQVGNAAFTDFDKKTESFRAKLAADLKAAQSAVPSALPTPREIVVQRNAAVLKLSDMGSEGERYIRREIVMQTLVLLYDNRLAEIRKDLAAMEPLECEASLFSAARSRDPRDLDVLLAFASATRTRPLVDEESLQEATKKWLELNNPAGYTAVETVREALAMLLGNLEASKRVIASAAGVPLDDDVQADVNAGIKLGQSEPPVVPKF